MAEVPGLRRYCALVARGQARLLSDPDAAQTAADEADAVLPGHAAPKVLRARVAFRRGELERARELFESAVRQDPRALDQPLALFDFAAALRRTGRLTEALVAYRELAPRTALLPNRTSRALALLEAAHVALACATDEASRPLLDEAAAYLREAARDPHQPYRADVTLTLALALDRAGHAAQADALLGERSESTSPAPTTELGYLARPSEGMALEALALEAQGSSQAAARWEKFLAAVPAGDLAAQAATRRLARLRSTRPPTRRRRGR